MWQLRDIWNAHKNCFRSWDDARARFQLNVNEERYYNTLVSAVPQVWIDTMLPDNAELQDGDFVGLFDESVDAPPFRVIRISQEFTLRMTSGLISVNLPFSYPSYVVSVRTRHCKSSADNWSDCQGKGQIRGG